MKIPDSYSNTKTYKGRTAACEPFELARIPLVTTEDDEGNRPQTRLFRLVVVGKHGLGAEHDYADIPVAVAEELTGFDRMKAEVWCEVADASAWATMAAGVIMQAQHEHVGELRSIGRIIMHDSTASAAAVTSQLEGCVKNLGLLLNKTGRVARPGHQLGSPSLAELENMITDAVGRLGELLQPDGPRLDLGDMLVMLRALTRSASGEDVVPVLSLPPERYGRLHNTLHAMLVERLPAEVVDSLNLGVVIRRELGAP